MFMDVLTHGDRQTGKTILLEQDTFSLEVYRDWQGTYGWRLVNQRHYVLATSGEKYLTPEIALSAARAVKLVFPAAEVAPLGEAAFAH